MRRRTSSGGRAAAGRLPRPRFHPRIAAAGSALAALLLGAAATTALAPEERLGPTGAPPTSPEPIPGVASAGAPSTLALVGGTLLRGPELVPVSDGIVVVRAGRIVCAGRPHACPVPDAAEVVPVHGRWVLPGLIDTHVHLARGRRLDPALEQARRFASGVTMTREASTRGRLNANLALRGRSAAAAAALPRLLVTGRLSVATRRSGTADDPQAARHLAEAGVDAIKLKEPRPPATRTAVHREAVERGLPVYGHVVPKEPPDTSSLDPLLAGMDGVSHLHALPYLAIRDWSRVPPAPGPEAPPPERRRWTAGLWLEAEEARLRQVAGRMAARGVWLEPTLVGEWEFLEHAGAGPGDRDARAAVAVFLRTFLDAGGLLLAGSDAMTAAEPDLHDELRLLVGAGLTPREALRAATSDAARALGRRDVGVLEAGRMADLVVLDADPLADVRHTRLVWRVLKGGIIHVPGEVLRVARDEAETREREPAAGPHLLAAVRRTVVGHGSALLGGTGALILGASLLGLWRLREID